jgi:hypothetical protein
MTPDFIRQIRQAGKPGLFKRLIRTIENYQTQDPKRGLIFRNFLCRYPCPTRRNPMVADRFGVGWIFSVAP